MGIEELRRKQDEHQIAVYEEYESALREKYVSLSPEERIDFLRGLEFLIAEDNQELANLKLQKQTRGIRTKRSKAKEYLQTISDKKTKELVEYMLREGADKEALDSLKTQNPKITAQNEAVKRGINRGTWRSYMTEIFERGHIPVSSVGAKIAEYLVEQGYEPKK